MNYTSKMGGKGCKRKSEGVSGRLVRVMSGKWVVNGKRTTLLFHG